MLFKSRLFWIVFLILGITAATNAQAVNQLYRVSEVSWSVKAHGNECSVADPSPGPHCGNGASESWQYSAVGFPQGIQCNANQPRCRFSKTPTDGSGNFAPLGGNNTASLYCAPWYNWGGNGTAVRPAKGMTLTAGGPGKSLMPPLYRNPVFFTSGGSPGTTHCTATSTGLTPGGKGRVQAGNPVTGTLVVSGTGGAKGGFDFPAAPLTGSSGLRATGVAGEPRGYYPYEYSYTYATLRNATGYFGSWGGAGSFNIVHKQGGTVASINVKQGAARFGGTMRMLGALTSKHCYYRNGGCSRATKDWLYSAIGASVYTTLGSPITQGYLVYGTVMYFHSRLGQASTVNVEGSRFPWTTGSVTVTAAGRGPHKTVHYAQGYDNRASIRSHYSRGTYLVGTLQLVTPVLTRWLKPAVNFETVGIGILRFAPEPHGWVMLVAGLSLLAVGYRMRKPDSAARDGR